MNKKSPMLAEVAMKRSVVDKTPEEKAKEDWLKYRCSPMTSWAVARESKVWELEIKPSIDFALAAEREDVISRFRKFNGSIKNLDDLEHHMERLQKCSWCKRDFYDKLCPTCVSDEVEERLKEERKKDNEGKK